MSDTVRITFHEAEKVKEFIRDYGDACHRTGESTSQHHPQIEDLVNRIGEVYETALARAIKESVSEVREGMSEGR